MKKVQTVYDHIRSNNIKTAVLVALFPLFFIALIFLFVWAVAPLNQAVETTVSVAVPTFIACKFFDDGHSDWCKVIPHCGFDVQFSKN